MLWISNKENLSKSTGATSISESGIYDLVIKEVEVFKSKNSSATALVLKVETTDGETATIKHFFKNANGEQVEFVTRLLDHLIFLTKTPNIETGKELENKKVAAFILVKDNYYDGKTYKDYTVQEYYEINSKRTAKEITNQEQGSVAYELAKKRVEKIKAKAKTIEEEAEEFPF